MKTLVVYYSMGGNTAWAAGQIAKALDAQTLRLEPVKGYPKQGFQKFFWGGKSAVMAETPELFPYSFERENWDLVILGFPVWAGNITPPIRSFVRDNDLGGLRIAAFACESGAGADKAFRKLRACPGIDSLEQTLVLVDPKDKPSPDNLRLIREFCAKLAET